MRYKLDAAGYVSAVAFGCYLDNCAEYTGAVPMGYETLNDWSEKACINAYYIDASGNLTLDSERLAEIKQKEAQQEIDNAPLLRKDLYETDEIFDGQYVKQTETGKVIVLEGIKTIAPCVKITGINPYEYSKLGIYTQGKQMMPNDTTTQKVAGVTFTRNPNGSLTVNGMSTENIEYTVSGSGANSTPLFALKSNHDYYLNLGGFDCELRYFDGETTSQQYIGASGLLNLPQHKEVTEVILKIPSGKLVDVTFYPQLECGNAFTSYAEYKSKTLWIDWSDDIDLLYPSETLYPSATLYPKGVSVKYITIKNGAVNINLNGLDKYLGTGSVGLFSSYDTIYATKDVTLEIEYSTSMLDVDSLEFLQGKSTTTNQFKILKDGSIEAHNGYFSGRIEADSGYFKGEISWSQVTGNEDVATKTYIDDKGYQNASQVTKITKDTVTTSYIKALNLTVGNEIQMGANATISWGNVTNQPTIPTNTNQLTNGAGYTTMSAVEGKGYQNASQVTQITKDTVTTSYIKALNLTVGNEIQMGSNATISWSQVTGTGDIATQSYVTGLGYQTAAQVTQITKDTITTSYVNALKVTAGSVAAENITGTTITGKTLKGVTGEFKGTITATGGTIGGFTIGTSSLYNGKSSLASNTQGVYVGTDGIAVGYGGASGPAFKVTSAGDVSLRGSGEINFGSGVNSASLSASKIAIGNTYFAKDTVHVAKSSSATTYYTDINGDEIELHGASLTGYLKIGSSQTVWASSSGTYYLKDNSGSELMAISNDKLSLHPDTLALGNYTGYIGFFGGTKYAKKQTVSTITSTSSATASTNAAKINELINALKAYNLIG